MKTNERWVIGLVRYENSQNFYTSFNAELKDVQYVLEREYKSRAAAQRVVSSWCNSSRTKPAKLPYYRDSRDRLPNGRYQVFQWEPIPLDANGVPGFQDGRAAAYKLVEYPYYNDKDAKDKYLARRQRWPESGPVWAFFIKKGDYAGRIATWTDEEYDSPGVETGHDARLLDPGVFQGDTITLWKGMDY